MILWSTRPMAEMKPLIAMSRWDWTEIVAAITAGTLAVTAITSTLARVWLKLVGLHAETIIAEIQAATEITKAASERATHASDRATVASDRATVASDRVAVALNGDLRAMLKDKVEVLRRLAEHTNLESDRALLGHAETRLRELETLANQYRETKARDSSCL